MSWGSESTSKRPDSSTSGLSKQTQDLLSEVMQKRGLSIRAMGDVSASLRRGDSNWADHLSTSTSTFQKPASKLNTKVKVPKFPTGRQPQIPNTLLPASFSGKRIQTTPAERDMWVGGAPAPNRELEKDHLSKLMEVGAKGMKELERKEAERKEQALRRNAECNPVNPKEALIDQIVEEIKERREFLEEMQACRQAPKYEAAIKGEIASRMKDLERLGMDVKTSRPTQIKSQMIM